MRENNLKKYIDDFFDNITLYDDYYNNHHYKNLLKESISIFLDNKNDYSAMEVYEIFFMIYQIIDEDKSDELSKDNDISIRPNLPLDFVKLMKKYVDNAVYIVNNRSNWFIHSVNVFILGLAIYSQNKTYRDTFEIYVTNSPYKKYYKIDGKFSHEEFLFRWGIASLMHDIAAPFEIGSLGKPVKRELSHETKTIFMEQGDVININLMDIEELNFIPKMDFDFFDEFERTFPLSKFLDLFKPTNLMAHKISQDFPDVDSGMIENHLNSFAEIMESYGFWDHGYVSALLILNFYGYLIQKYHKDYSFFFYPIVDSATAILLHNYYRNVLRKRPFDLGSMHPMHSPLAYLLILCDELQTWNDSPFGHANDLKLNITNDRLDADYIVKGGSMGLGFSGDKEELLNYVLSIRSIFRKGVLIFTDVQQDNSISSGIAQSEIRTPNTLFRNVEKLAIQIHQQYVDTITSYYEENKSKGEIDDVIKEEYENLTDFDDLSAHLKIEYMRQARSIPKKLNRVGYELANLSDKREAITEFSENEVIDLAIYEHDEWCVEKIGQGWSYGEVKDIENLVTPYLVPWDILMPETQQYDIDSVKNMPSLVNSIGLKIVKSKSRILAIEMYKFYQSTESNTESFEKLPSHIKYSNYNRTDFLIKILSELGYSIVDFESPSQQVAYLDEGEIEYLAMEEHNEWYQNKINLGWKFGPIFDNDLKLNPNLVDWYVLDRHTQENNKRIFENLPLICRNVNLKIVKNN